MKTISLAIIEDDRVVQDSLQCYFNMQEYIDVLPVMASVESFLEEVAPIFKPDILLLDINLLGMSGIKGIPLLKEQFPDLDIIMLTTFDDNNSIFEALSAGACSYISKRTSLKKIKEAVETVHSGGSYMSPAIARKIADHFSPKQPNTELLTERQQEIVKGIVDGKSYKMIASDLFVSLDTVRSHIKNIYRALNINSKAELIKKAYNKEI